jgi:hypothetical protein
MQEAKWNMMLHNLRAKEVGEALPNRGHRSFAKLVLNDCYSQILEIGLEECLDRWMVGLQIEKLLGWDRLVRQLAQ